MMAKHTLDFLTAQAIQACDGIKEWHDMPVFFYCVGRKNPIIHGSEEVSRVLSEFMEGDIFKNALTSDYNSLSEAEREDNVNAIAAPPRQALRMMAANHPPARLEFPLECLTYHESWEWLSNEIHRRYECGGHTQFDRIR